jgi:hypothetical protein
MVKIIVVACFVLLLAIPALAQDDFPRIQTSMGYANLSFPDLTTGIVGHHSGFANETSFNLTKNYGLNNYMGIYGLGTGSTLISDFFGGKVMYRGTKVVPYALAGIGFGYFTAQSQFGIGAQSSFGTRYGGGVDIPWGDVLAIKAEYSRMAFHIALDPTNPNSTWTSGNNISVGVVFTLVQ